MNKIFFKNGRIRLMGLYCLMWIEQQSTPMVVEAKGKLNKSSYGKTKGISSETLLQLIGVSVCVGGVVKKNNDDKEIKHRINEEINKEVLKIKEKKEKQKRIEEQKEKEEIHLEKKNKDSLKNDSPIIKKILIVEKLEEDKNHDDKKIQSEINEEIHLKKKNKDSLKKESSIVEKEKKEQEIKELIEHAIKVYSKILSAINSNDDEEKIKISDFYEDIVKFIQKIKESQEIIKEPQKIIEESQEIREIKLFTKELKELDNKIKEWKEKENNHFKHYKELEEKHSEMFKSYQEAEKSLEEALEQGLGEDYKEVLKELYKQKLKELEEVLEEEEKNDFKHYKKLKAKLKELDHKITLLQKEQKEKQAIYEEKWSKISKENKRKILDSSITELINLLKNDNSQDSGQTTQIYELFQCLNEISNKLLKNEEELNKEKINDKLDLTENLPAEQIFEPNESHNKSLSLKIEEKEKLQEEIKEKIEYFNKEKSNLLTEMEIDKQNIPIKKSQNLSIHIIIEDHIKKPMQKKIETIINELKIIESKFSNASINLLEIQKEYKEILEKIPNEIKKAEKKVEKLELSKEELEKTIEEKIKELQKKLEILSNIIQNTILQDKLNTIYNNNTFVFLLDHYIEEPIYNILLESIPELKKIQTELNTEVENEEVEAKYKKILEEIENAEQKVEENKIKKEEETKKLQELQNLIQTLSNKIIFISSMQEDIVEDQENLEEKKIINLFNYLRQHITKEYITEEYMTEEYFKEYMEAFIRDVKFLNTFINDGQNVFILKGKSDSKQWFDHLVEKVRRLQLINQSQDQISEYISEIQELKQKNENILNEYTILMKNLNEKYSLEIKYRDENNYYGDLKRFITYKENSDYMELYDNVIKSCIKMKTRLFGEEVTEGSLSAIQKHLEKKFYLIQSEEANKIEQIYKNELVKWENKKEDEKVIIETLLTKLTQEEAQEAQEEQEKKEELQKKISLLNHFKTNEGLKDLLVLDIQEIIIYFGMPLQQIRLEMLTKEITIAQEVYNKINSTLPKEPREDEEFTSKNKKKKLLNQFILYIDIEQFINKLIAINENIKYKNNSQVYNILIDIYHTLINEIEQEFEIELIPIELIKIESEDQVEQLKEYIVQKIDNKQKNIEKWLGTTTEESIKQDIQEVLKINLNMIKNFLFLEDNIDSYSIILKEPLNNLKDNIDSYSIILKEPLNNLKDNIDRIKIAIAVANHNSIEQYKNFSNDESEQNIYDNSNIKFDNYSEQGLNTSQEMMGKSFLANYHESYESQEAIKKEERLLKEIRHNETKKEKIFEIVKILLNKIDELQIEMDNKEITELSNKTFEYMLELLNHLENLKNIFDSNDLLQQLNLTDETLNTLNDKIEEYRQISEKKEIKKEYINDEKNNFRELGQDTQRAALDEKMEELRKYLNACFIDQTLLDNLQSILDYLKQKSSNSEIQEIEEQKNKLQESINKTIDFLKSQIFVVDNTIKKDIEILTENINNKKDIITTDEELEKKIQEYHLKDPIISVIIEKIKNLENNLELLQKSFDQQNLEALKEEYGTIVQDIKSQITETEAEKEEKKKQELAGLENLLNRIIALEEDEKQSFKEDIELLEIFINQQPKLENLSLFMIQKIEEWFENLLVEVIKLEFKKYEVKENIKQLLKDNNLIKKIQNVIIKEKQIMLKNIEEKEEFFVDFLYEKLNDNKIKDLFKKQDNVTQEGIIEIREKIISLISEGLVEGIYLFINNVSRISDLIDKESLEGYEKINQILANINSVDYVHTLHILSVNHFDYKTSWLPLMDYNEKRDTQLFTINSKITSYTNIKNTTSLNLVSFNKKITNIISKMALQILSPIYKLNGEIKKKCTTKDLIIANENNFDISNIENTYNKRTDKELLVQKLKKYYPNSTNNIEDVECLSRTAIKSINKKDINLNSFKELLNLKTDDDFTAYIESVKEFLSENNIQPVVIIEEKPEITEKEIKVETNLNENKALGEAKEEPVEEPGINTLNNESSEKKEETNNEEIKLNNEENKPVVIIEEKPEITEKEIKVETNLNENKALGEAKEEPVEEEQPVETKKETEAKIEKKIQTIKKMLSITQQEMKPIESIKYISLFDKIILSDINRLPVMLHMIKDIMDELKNFDLFIEIITTIKTMKLKKEETIHNIKIIKFEHNNNLLYDSFFQNLKDCKKYMLTKNNNVLNLIIFFEYDKYLITSKDILKARRYMGNEAIMRYITPFDRIFMPFFTIKEEHIDSKLKLEDLRDIFTNIYNAIPTKEKQVIYNLLLGNNFYKKEIYQKYQGKVINKEIITNLLKDIENVKIEEIKNIKKQDMQSAEFAPDIKTIHSVLFENNDFYNQLKQIIEQFIDYDSKNSQGLNQKEESSYIYIGNEQLCTTNKLSINQKKTEHLNIVIYENWKKTEQNDTIITQLAQNQKIYLCKVLHHRLYNAESSAKLYRYVNLNSKDIQVIDMLDRPSLLVINLIFTDINNDETYNDLIDKIFKKQKEYIKELKEQDSPYLPNIQIRTIHNEYIPLNMIELLIFNKVHEETNKDNKKVLLFYYRFKYFSNNILYNLKHDEDIGLQTDKINKIDGTQKENQNYYFEYITKIYNTYLEYNNIKNKENLFENDLINNIKNITINKMHDIFYGEDKKSILKYLDICTKIEEKIESNNKEQSVELDNTVKNLEENKQQVVEITEKENKQPEENKPEQKTESKVAVEPEIKVEEKKPVVEIIEESKQPVAIIEETNLNENKPAEIKVSEELEAEEPTKQNNNKNIEKVEQSVGINSENNNIAGKNNVNALQTVEQNALNNESSEEKKQVKEESKQPVAIIEETNLNENKPAEIKVSEETGTNNENPIGTNLNENKPAEIKVSEETGTNNENPIGTNLNESEVVKVEETEVGKPAANIEKENKPVVEQPEITVENSEIKGTVVKEEPAGTAIKLEAVEEKPEITEETVKENQIKAEITELLQILNKDQESVMKYDKLLNENKILNYEEVEKILRGNIESSIEEFKKAITNVLQITSNTSNTSNEDALLSMLENLLKDKEKKSFSPYIKLIFTNEEFIGFWTSKKEEIDNNSNNLIVLLESYKIALRFITIIQLISPLQIPLIKNLVKMILDSNYEKLNILKFYGLTKQIYEGIIELNDYGVQLNKIIVMQGPAQFKKTVLEEYLKLKIMPHILNIKFIKILYYNNDIENSTNDLVFKNVNQKFESIFQLYLFNNKNNNINMLIVMNPSVLYHLITNCYKTIVEIYKDKGQEIKTDNAKYQKPKKEGEGLKTNDEIIEICARNTLYDIITQHLHTIFNEQIKK